jgi:hypothetical protein
VEHVNDDDGTLDAGMNKDQENVRGESGEWSALNVEDQASVVERRVGCSDGCTPVMA